MSPRMRLLVYYVLPGGETVADAVVVDVAEETKNQVRVWFLIIYFTHQQKA